MRDLGKIVEAFEVLAAAGQSAALATVTAVEGSSYRAPGARMLIAGDGRTWGTISGGCLERDVARRGRIVIDTGKAQVCCYETGQPEETDGDALAADPGPTLGCGGRIDILIEPVSLQYPGAMPALIEVIRNRRSCTLATVARVDGVTDSRDGAMAIGQHLIRLGGETICDIVDESARNAIASRLLDSSEFSGQIRHALPNGITAEIFIEKLNPPLWLWIFGDGPDVEPLMEMAGILGWGVSVAAAGSAASLRRKFARAQRVQSVEWSDPTPAAQIAGMIDSENSAAIVMNHHLRRDAAAVRCLANSGVRYVGILGPRHRTVRLLRAAGLDDPSAPSASARARLYWPVGLDIGARSPEQIALAVVAEIQAVFSGSPAKFLRDRPGTIHANRPSDAVAARWSCAT